MSEEHNLERLRKIAEQATPGPWQWGPEESRWGDCGPNLETVERGPLYADGSQGAAAEVVGSWGHDANGILVEDHDKAFIAAFNPEAALALLSRLEQAEQAVARVREVATAMANHSLPEAPRGGAWETAHGAQLFAKDILETLDGEQS